MTRLTMATALTVAVLAVPAWAQAPAGHDHSHPADSEKSAAAPPAPAPSPSTAAPQGGSGMMGGGMSGQPLYRDTDNRAYSGNKPMGRFDSASMPPPRAATSSIARGGFGRSVTGTVSS